MSRELLLERMRRAEHEAHAAQLAASDREDDVAATAHRLDERRADGIARSLQRQVAASGEPPA